MKRCIACHDLLPVAAFPARKGRYSARCRSCTTEQRRIHKHGMDSSRRLEIAAKQGGCFICHRTDPGVKGWVVDHDRACCPGDRSCAECRRGVLCQWCNSALGYALDSPELLRAMADYIEGKVRLGE